MQDPRARRRTLERCAGGMAGPHYPRRCPYRVGLERCRRSTPGTPVDRPARENPGAPRNVARTLQPHCSPGRDESGASLWGTRSSLSPSSPHEMGGIQPATGWSQVCSDGNFFPESGRTIPPIPAAHGRQRRPASLSDGQSSCRCSSDGLAARRCGEAQSAFSLAVALRRPRLGAGCSASAGAGAAVASFGFRPRPIFFAIERRASLYSGATIG